MKNFHTCKLSVSSLLIEELFFYSSVLQALSGLGEVLPDTLYSCGHCKIFFQLLLHAVLHSSLSLSENKELISPTFCSLPNKKSNEDEVGGLDSMISEVASNP